MGRCDWFQPIIYSARCFRSSNSQRESKTDLLPRVTTISKFQRIHDEFGIMSERFLITDHCQQITWKTSSVHLHVLWWLSWRKWIDVITCWLLLCSSSVPFVYSVPICVTVFLNDFIQLSQTYVHKQQHTTEDVPCLPYYHPILYINTCFVAVFTLPFLYVSYQVVPFLTFWSS